MIGVVGAVQFVNILDFMMVMPLGPDFAVELGVDPNHLGVIGGAYTAAAAVGGVIGAFVLDRFDRRRALGLCMMGLALGTAAGALAWDLPSMVAARLLAGLFGGPATAVALSIIADRVPPERRGRAMGAVMGAFSVASVLGVPAGLEAARLFGWRAPFLGVAGLALVITGAALLALPTMTDHLQGPRHKLDLPALVASRRVVLSYLLVAVTFGSSFALVPNFSAFIQGNLGMPREQLSILYLIGGAISFGSMRLAGIAADRVGSARVGTVGYLAFAAVGFVGFVLVPPPVSVFLIFPAFMIAQTSRNVAQQSLLSKVPRPQERAGFMSLQSAVSHLASAVGAIGSAALLTPGPGVSLVGMPRLALIVIGVSALSVPLLFSVERSLLPPPAR